MTTEKWSLNNTELQVIRDGYWFELDQADWIHKVQAGQLTIQYWSRILQLHTILLGYERDHLRTNAVNLTQRPLRILCHETLNPDLLGGNYWWRHIPTKRNTFIKKCILGFCEKVLDHLEKLYSNPFLNPALQVTFECNISNFNKNVRRGVRKLARSSSVSKTFRQVAQSHQTIVLISWSYVNFTYIFVSLMDTVGKKAQNYEESLQACYFYSVTSLVHHQNHTYTTGLFTSVLSLECGKPSWMDMHVTLEQTLSQHSSL